MNKKALVLDGLKETSHFSGQEYILPILSFSCFAAKIGSSTIKYNVMQYNVCLFVFWIERHITTLSYYNNQTKLSLGTTGNECPVLVQETETALLES